MKKYQPKIYDDDKLKNKCGIYQIRNLKNNKIYVGSSNNLFQRKNLQLFINFLLEVYVYQNSHHNNWQS